MSTIKNIYQNIMGILLRIVIGIIFVPVVIMLLIIITIFSILQYKTALQDMLDILKNTSIDIGNAIYKDKK